MTDGTKRHGGCCLILIALGVVLFSQGLASSEWVVSDAGKDTGTYYYYRYWLAQQYRQHGEILTWNPHIHCGTPAMGTFQYSLWHPLHWLGTFMPVSLLINWMVFLHVCIAGIGMYGWCILRGLRSSGALIAGMIYMMCGPLFSKVPVGDVPHLCVMALSPFIFWGIDGWFRCRRRRWIALAAGAATMQLYSGYPPLAFYTAMAAGGYAFLELWKSWKETRGCRLRLSAGLLSIYPLALLASALEWLPAIMLIPESTRNSGLTGDFLIRGAVSPEQLLLLVAPKLFGGFSGAIWWGNEHFYTIIAYCGVGGLLLATTGWIGMPWRERWRWAALLIVPLLVAFGPYTPLMGLLNEWVPMFSRMRSLGRIAMLFALFLAPLAGVGMDRLINKAGRVDWASRGIAMFAGVASVVLLIFGLMLRGGTLDETFRFLVERIITHPGYEFAQDRQNPAWWILVRDCAAWGLIGGGAWLLWFGTGIFCATTRIAGRWIQVAFVLSVALEMLWFAKPLARYYPTETMEYKPLANFIAQHQSGEWRDMNLVNRNADMIFKSESMWGYETLMLRRHAELMAVSQGYAPELGNEDMPQFRQNSKLFQMLRGRYLFVPTPNGIQVQPLQQYPLPRFLMAGKYQVLENRDEIFSCLSHPNFNFWETVILEEDPGFPQRTDTAPHPVQIRVLSSSASRWEIEIDTPALGVLLMTDSYAKGWKARALPGSVQQNYKFQPANYALRGIPITEAGRHRIEIKYTAPGFAAGIVITIITLLLLAAIVVRKKIKLKV